MKRKNKNLRTIADSLWTRTLNGWRPTGREIQNRYKLSEPQFNYVKRLVRETAKEAGVGWGYYPETGQYLLVQFGQPGIAQAVLNYQLRHWQEEGRSADLTVSAFAAQGYVTKELERQVHVLATEFDGRIERIRTELEPTVKAA